MIRSFYIRDQTNLDGGYMAAAIHRHSHYTGSNTWEDHAHLMHDDLMRQKHFFPKPVSSVFTDEDLYFVQER